MIDIRLEKCVIKPLMIFYQHLKFVPDWLVTSKMIKKFLIALNADENIPYFNEDYGDAIFS